MVCRETQQAPIREAYGAIPSDACLQAMPACAMQSSHIWNFLMHHTLHERESYGCMAAPLQQEPASSLQKAWLAVQLEFNSCQDKTGSRDFTRLAMSGTSSAAIAAALVTTGALKQREGCAGAALRMAVPNTPGLWPTGDVTRADCMLGVTFVDTVCYCSWQRPVDRSRDPPAGWGPAWLTPWAVNHQARQV